MDAVEIVLVIVLPTKQNVKTTEVFTMVAFQLVLNVVLIVLDVLEMLPLVHSVLMDILELIVHQLVMLIV